MIIEKQASSVPEVLANIKDIRREWNPTRKRREEIWFRGQSKRSYTLIPGLYRPQVIKYKYDEISLFLDFKGLAGAFASPRPSNDWEWYFLAQHYRLPTRLLDWTENALAAIYFAISDEFLKKDRAYFEIMLAKGTQPALYNEDSPSIWMLDPGTLNKWSYNERFLFATPGEYADHFLPEALKDQVSARENINPVAIYTPRTNRRIIAQQGCFTVHGRQKVPIDEIAIRHNDKGVLRLARISLDRNNLAPIWDDLEIAGVRQVTLFPELESVSEYLKRAYQSTD